MNLLIIFILKQLIIWSCDSHSVGCGAMVGKEGTACGRWQVIQTK